MPSNPPMPTSQRVVQICLFLVAAIAMLGGTLQMFLGQPDTSPRLDNVHRFMAGVYFSTGLINLWAAITIRRQRTLVYLLALGGASCRRRKAGVDEPGWTARTGSGLAGLPHSRTAAAGCHRSGSHSHEAQCIAS